MQCNRVNNYGKRPVPKYDFKAFGAVRTGRKERVGQFNE